MLDLKIRNQQVRGSTPRVGSLFSVGYGVTPDGSLPRGSARGSAPIPSEPISNASPSRRVHSTPGLKGVSFLRTLWRTSDSCTARSSRGGRNGIRTERYLMSGPQGQRGVNRKCVGRYSNGPHRSLGARRIATPFVGASDHPTSSGAASGTHRSARDERASDPSRSQ